MELISMDIAAAAKQAIVFRQHFPVRREQARPSSGEGVYQFWISPDDLKARRFDKVELTADAY